ncbi:DUF4232 domain-containing protein [Streptomyces inhibens]|uniref:DUF4232 domain-containing protein n=1 Tax=Streptomyces inhibens TaxID=2293571 RepID=A0A371PXM6_STRIH|nr:DUF4232 domain-containing protein [Streptomyces inhibens]REK87225.1 DUF4232 domain-containing protein [Streptomyces inhibens]
MSARTTRTRLFAATTVALAALALTACESGKGTKDEGASTTSQSSTKPGASGSGDSTSKPAGNGGSTPGAGTSDSSTSGKTSSGTTGATGATSGKNTDSSTGNSTGTGTKNPACNGSNTKTTATELTRPLNTLLLTVTNTGSKNCDLLGYPIARFGEAQAVPPVDEKTHPQAVVTLAPGKSGYASVLMSMGDGSGKNGYTANTLTVAFNSGKTARPALPAKGVYVDDKIQVTYWQSTMDDAVN